MIRFVLGIILVIGAGSHTDMTLFALQAAAGLGLLLWCLPKVRSRYNGHF